MSPTRFFIRAALLGAIAAIGLTGCGRRGDLEPAPESGLSSRQAREQAPGATPNQGDTLEINRRVRNVVPSKDPFFLDPLL